MFPESSSSDRAYWDFADQKNVYIERPDELTEAQARRLVPQTKRAQWLFGGYHAVSKMPLVDVVRNVNDRVFGRDMKA